MRCKGVAVRKELYDHHRLGFEDRLSNRLFDVSAPKRTKHGIHAHKTVFKFDEWFETIRDQFSTPIGAEEVRLYLLGQNLVTQVTRLRLDYHPHHMYPVDGVTIPSLTNTLSH